MSRLQKLVPMAKILGVSPYALRQGARKGQYPHLIIAGKYYFDEDAMRHFIAQAMGDSLRDISEAKAGLSSTNRHWRA